MQLQGPSCAGLPHKLWQTAPHLSASSTSSPHLWTSHLRPQLTHSHKSPGWELATVRLVFLIATMTIYTEAGHACLSVQTHMWEIRAVCSSVCTCVWLKEGMGLFRGFDKCVGGGGGRGGTTPCSSSMPTAEVNASTSLLRISGLWEVERLLHMVRGGRVEFQQPIVRHGLVGEPCFAP